MSKFSRRTKIIAAFIIVVAAGYGASLFFRREASVPQAFTNARSQGAIIAQNIVNLSNQSTDDLSEINQLDEEGNYSEALTLTTNLVTQSEDLRNQAVDLSGQVGEMTKDLSSINNFNARQAALESISSRLALINQLINYSGDLEHLLDTLQVRFSGKYVAPGTVQGIVNQINTDVNAINNFNSQAGQAMDQFDKIVKS